MIELMSKELMTILRVKLLKFLVLFWLIALPSAGLAQVEKEVQQGLANLLRIGGIGQEIQMTEVQFEKLFGLWLETKFEMEQAFQRYNDNLSDTLPAEKTAQLKKQLDDAIVKIREKEFQRIKDTLNDDQLTRLKQLRIQYLTRKSDGIESLQEELDLTAAQIRRIQQVADNTQKELMKLREAQRVEKLTKMEIVEFVKQIREKSKQQIEALLTNNQKQKLIELMGKSFDFESGHVEGPKESTSDSSEVEQNDDAINSDGGCNHPCQLIP